jgi:hypothetical protein
MSAAATKKCLSEILSEAFSAPLEINRQADPLFQYVDRLSASGPYKGLQVFQGDGVAARSAQPLPPLRPRRPLW